MTTSAGGWSAWGAEVSVGQCPIVHEAGIDDMDLGMTQDERWMVRYNEVKAFIEGNKRRPSKYTPEERNAWNWLRHTQKQYGSGELKAARVEMFEKLLALCEEYRRVNQHKYTSETVVCLCGRIVEEFYDELERICTDRIELTPCGPNFLVNVPAGQWHTVRALESGSVLLECKDGKYEPLGPEVILSL